MDEFNLALDLGRALELYLLLKEREEELPAAVRSLFDHLRSYLYERLSIDDIERPQEFLSRLDGVARPDQAR